MREYDREKDGETIGALSRRETKERRDAEEKRDKEKVKVMNGEQAKDIM